MDYDELVQRLRKPEVRHYQVSGTGDSYRTALCERQPLPILIEAADAIVQLQDDLAAARALHMTAEERLDYVSLMLAGADKQIDALAASVAFHERNALRAEANLAAARALLGEATIWLWLGDNDDEESLLRRITSALSGKDAPKS
jgi:hypothetical protein